MAMTPFDWANFALAIWPIVEKLIALLEGFITDSKAGEVKKRIVMATLVAVLSPHWSNEDMDAMSKVVDEKVARFNAKGWPVT